MLAPSSSVQPVSRRCRSRSMSVCVPSSYSFPHVPPLLAVPPKQPSTPPPDLSSSSSYTTTPPCVPLSAERDTFAGRLSKALETVLPIHSTPSLPRARQRRASLPALFSTPVGSQPQPPGTTADAILKSIVWSVPLPFSAADQHTWPLALLSSINGYYPVHLHSGRMLVLRIPVFKMLNPSKGWHLRLQPYLSFLGWSCILARLLLLRLNC